MPIGCQSDICARQQNGATKALRPAEDGELAWAKEKCRVGGDNAPVAEREDEGASSFLRAAAAHTGARNSSLRGAARHGTAVPLPLRRWLQ